MKIFGFEIKRAKQPVKVKNLFDAARNDRFTGDWLVGNQAADELLKWSLRIMRNRSRDLSQNNDHAANFFRKLKNNVVGADGFTMQSKVRYSNGKLQENINEQIEEAWVEWSKKANASVCGTLSLRDQLNLAVESTARDGDVLIRKIKGFSDNKFRFSLQVLEADHLDEKLNVPLLSNGNSIHLGVEKNPWGRPVAYHIFASHPGDLTNATLGLRRLRVPADEIIHPFVKVRASQSRGIPWMHTAIVRLRMLGAYEEAALIASRIGAAKMGFLIPPTEGGEYGGDGKDDKGNTISEVEPGLLEQLPAGFDFKEFNPAYPAGEFPQFQKAMLRGIAAGIGCSYNSLASDLEGVNFSSLRSGALEERDAWKSVQSWFIDSVINEIFPDWLEWAVLSKQLDLNYSQLEEYNKPKWQGRRWEWVDPLRDIQARVEELKAGLTTRTRICAEQGDDFEDILEELAEEKGMMDEYGLFFDLQTSPKAIEQILQPDQGATGGQAGQGGNDE